MLKTTIELFPYGEEEDKKSLAYILIANIGSPGSAFYKYAYVVYEPHPIVGDAILHTGIIDGYDRYRPAVDLLGIVLENYLSKSPSYPVAGYEKAVIEVMEDQVKKYYQDECSRREEHKSW